MYIQKAERKNRTKEEVDHVICWLTGYGQAELQRQIDLESIVDPRICTVSTLEFGRIAT